MQSNQFSDGSWSHVCHEHCEFDRNGMGGRGWILFRFNVQFFFICQVIATYFYELSGVEMCSVLRWVTVVAANVMTKMCHDASQSHSPHWTMGSRKMCCMRDIHCRCVPRFPHRYWQWYRRMRDTVQIDGHETNIHAGPNGAPFRHLLQQSQCNYWVYNELIVYNVRLQSAARRYIYLTRKTNNALCILLLTHSCTARARLPSGFWCSNLHKTRSEPATRCTFVFWNIFRSNFTSMRVARANRAPDVIQSIIPHSNELFSSFFAHIFAVCCVTYQREPTQQHEERNKRSIAYA